MQVNDSIKAVILKWRIALNRDLYEQQIISLEMYNTMNDNLLKHLKKLGEIYEN